MTVKNPFLDSLPMKALPTSLMDPSKLISLAQEQQADTMQTAVAVLSCRDPMALMSLQQAFMQRSIDRWTKGVLPAAKPDHFTHIEPPRKVREEPAPKAAAPRPAAAPVMSLVEKQIEKATEVLEAANAQAQSDDLTAIKGIGPKFAATLAEHGITSFRKLASLTEKEIDELEEKLGFSGRFAREGWVEQAKALATH